LSDRPRLLDLFCGAGGAAMGYHRAGFDVVGVDLSPQPHYPFEFIRADALEALRLVTAARGNFDAIHASPPCQRYSVANNIHQRDDHPDLVGPVREALKAAGRPWVIENVPGAPLLNPVTLCGLTFGLNVKRHRLFEYSGFWLWAPDPCPPGHPGDWLLVFGHTVLTRGHVTGRAKGGGPTIRREHVGAERGRQAMGIDWMNRDELSESIPPAYTEFIGRQLLAAIEAGEAA
jgi:DNA (cytosine-5)-methyltransferase 1